MLDPERLRRHLQAVLTPKRYRHSLLVQKRAAVLARTHGADWYRASTAALCHDICHCMEKSAQLKYLSDHGILLDALSLHHPPIWHAVTGSTYLKNELGIRDAEVLRAVRYHTTARPAMSDLEMVVFLADKTSDDRTYPGADQLRALSNRSLEDAMAAALTHNIQHLRRQHQPIVGDALEAYRYYSQI